MSFFSVIGNTCVKYIHFTNVGLFKKTIVCRLLYSHNIVHLGASFVTVYCTSLNCKNNNINEVNLSAQ